MSGDPNVLHDGNHLDVLRRHVRDESIDLVDGVSSDPLWQEVMERAFGWFLGDNDLGMPLADPDHGSCRDGLGPDGVNGNMGAESTCRAGRGRTDARPPQRGVGTTRRADGRRRRRWWVRVGSNPGHPAGRPIATSR
jgi:hypothetical protein